MTRDERDEAAFGRASATLLERFEAWLRGRRAAPGRGHDASEAVADAGLLLDWKFGYGDGDLGTWRAADVMDFLLDWCPRKLSASADDAATVPGSLALFFEFLGETDRLSARSLPAAELAGGSLALGPEYLAAMADPANWGMAKSLLAAAPAEVDLCDPHSVERFMESFNALPDEERDALLGPDASDGRPARLPAVAPPEAAEVARSRAEAPVLARFAALAAYAGDGCRLTQNGNLSLADARALVPLLGTGDVIDERIGDRTFKTRSSTDLRGLQLVFEWAKKAGFVKVRHHKVSATRAGLALAADPGGGFDRAAEALLALGPVSVHRPRRYLTQWDEIDRFVDGLTLHLLAGVLVADEPLPAAELSDLVAEALLDAYVWRIPDEEVGRHARSHSEQLLESLAMAGVVRLQRPDPAPDPALDPWGPPPWRLPDGTTVTLTAAGHELVARLLPDAGYEVPTLRFTEASAADLIAGTVSDGGPEALADEWGPWLAARSPEQAATDLAAAARTLTDPALQPLTVELLGSLGPEVAEAHMRVLACVDGASTFARCWLVDQGMASASALYDPGNENGFVAVLAWRLAAGDAPAVVDTFEVVGPPPAQLDLLGRLWRSDAPATLSVLEALGSAHPDKVVAKAARKAAFQYRSRVGVSA